MKNTWRFGEREMTPSTVAIARAEVVEGARAASPDDRLRCWVEVAGMG